MANTKISDLSTISEINANDLLLIVDESGSPTSCKTTVDALGTYIGAHYSEGGSLAGNATGDISLNGHNLTVSNVYGLSSENVEFRNTAQFDFGLLTSNIQSTSSGNITFSSGFEMQGHPIEMNNGGGSGGGNIYMDGGNIQFPNISGNYGLGIGSLIQTGSFDAGHGGDGGLSLMCVIGYELNWQAGYLSSSYNSGETFVNINMDRSGFNMLGNTINLNSGGGSGGGNIYMDEGTIHLDGTATLYSADGHSALTGTDVSLIATGDDEAVIKVLNALNIRGNALNLHDGSGTGGSNLNMDGASINLASTITIQPLSRDTNNRMLYVKQHDNDYGYCLNLDDQTSGFLFLKGVNNGDESTIAQFYRGDLSSHFYGDIGSQIVPGVAATGSLAIAGGTNDGDSITFNDGHGQTLTLVYQTTPVNPNEFNFVLGDTFFSTVFNTQATGASLGIIAVYDGNVTVNFTSNYLDAAGNVSITNGLGLSVSGMSGGADPYENWKIQQDGSAKLPVITVSQITSTYGGIDVFKDFVMHGHNLTMGTGSGSGGGDIKMDGGSINLPDMNGSYSGNQRITTGSFNNSTNAHGGISLICSLGCELNFQGGILSNYASGFIPLRLGSNIQMDNNNITSVSQISQTTQTLTDASTIAWNVNSGSIAVVTLTDVGRTLTISNALVGTIYILKIIQDGTGNRTITTWTNFKWANGVVPTLSTAPGAEDILSIISYDATNFYGVLQSGFA